MRILILALLVGCSRGEKKGQNVQAPAPPPPVVVAPPVVEERSQCLPGTSDSIVLRWVRELAAGGKILTTYWYDSTGATTVEGIDGRGCLSGFKVNL